MPLRIWEDGSKTLSFPIWARPPSPPIAAATKSNTPIPSVTGFAQPKRPVRVNSKSRDELQTVIAAVRAHEFPVAVQFVNFRD